MPSSTIAYIEIVTPDVQGVASLYEAVHGLSFSPPDATLGQALVADLSSGERLGIRAPLRDDEGPLTRLYYRTDALSTAVERAQDAGAEIALNGMEVDSGRAKIAIFLLGGMEHALWERL